MTFKEAMKRGERDALQGFAPIFRSTRDFGIIADGGDDHMSDEWSKEEREAYLEGYNNA